MSDEQAFEPSDQNQAQQPVVVNPPAQDRRDGQQRSRRGNLPAWLWAIFGIIFGITLPFMICLGFFVLLVAAAPAAGSAPAGPVALTPSVGIIRVQGAIVGGNAFGTVSGAETIVDLIERANEDNNIRAIVLRVDSPGGGVVASDEIYHALTQFDKPIVVSMGTTAASGGYYISAPADVIYAAPGTLTGSLGVISQFITAEELLDELGVEVTVITAGEVKDFGSINESLTEEEIAFWETILEETHERFITIVADGRGMTYEEAEVLADGRIFTGEQALEVGLVDEIGYIDDAIARAGELAGLGSDPNTIELIPELDFASLLLGIQSYTPQNELMITYQIIEEMSQPSLEYRLSLP
ncbi:MAG: signal peptide peptidase SppA [Chloroflexi bacterium]|nr:signal peptide peptidase SppA [Chloroflexota bacterium]